MKGCHCCLETDGTWRKSHCPALYFIEGFTNWISTASSSWSADCEARYFEKLTIWMADDFDDLGITSGSDLAVETLTQVESTSPELPSPSFVS